ncbi:MAG: efflux RND transporter periplasmic adaptor subunit [Phycisphaerales bacterium]|nr:efflux RND transporter periplasmic adaptor subunit [Phycisphaerales bacterium]
MDGAGQDKHRGSRAIRLIVRGAVGVVVLVVAMGVLDFMKRTRQAPQRAPAEAVAILTPVITTRVVDVPRVWEGYGTARALKVSNIAAEVAAQVVGRPERIEAGAEVADGELIVELDPVGFVDQLEAVRGRVSGLEAQLSGLDAERESAEAKLALAEERTALMESEVRRLEEAMSSAGVSAVELERQRRELARVRTEEQALREVLSVWPSRRANVAAQLTSERAALRLAERDLEHARVVAPFAGTLQEVRVQVGERVSPGEVVARLVDLSRIEVPVKVAASASGQIAAGDRAELQRVSGRGGAVAEIWTGRVARIAPEADEATRTITVFVEVEQGRAGTLLPGQFVMASVRAAGRDARVVVPRRAVERDRVLVVSADGKVEARPVQVERYIEAQFAPIDPMEHQWAVLGDGLEAGVQVLVTNVHMLPPGASVRAVDRALARDGKATPAGSVTP